MGRTSGIGVDDVVRFGAGVVAVGVLVVVIAGQPRGGVGAGVVDADEVEGVDADMEVGEVGEEAGEVVGVALTPLVGMGLGEVGEVVAVDVRFVERGNAGELDVEALEVVDVEVGAGAVASGLDRVRVDVVLAWGDSADDEMFEVYRSTERTGAALEFDLGVPDLPAGIRQGVAGMREGGVRLIGMPAAWGFGDVGRAPVPGGAYQRAAVRLIEVVEEGGE